MGKLFVASAERLGYYFLLHLLCCNQFDQLFNGVCMIGHVEVVYLLDDVLPVEVEAKLFLTGMPYFNLVQLNGRWVVRDRGSSAKQLKPHTRVGFLEASGLAEASELLLRRLVFVRLSALKELNLLCAENVGSKEE